MNALVRTVTGAEADPVAAWHDRLVPGLTFRGVNALTVDVEDYFQVEAFFGLIDRSDWSRYECRVERNTERVLALFEREGVKATFFALGWVAEHYPSLIRRIVAQGHELASHGLEHRRADSQNYAGFIADVARAKAILEDTAGVVVQGYRAASFSISERNLWSFDALAEAGYRYSSSIYPVRHDLYGVPRAPRFPFYPLAGRDLVEIPVTTSARLGVNFPTGGGGYFRLLPYSLSLANLRSVMCRDCRPCNFYFHPWEVDPEQPRIRGARWKTRLRHYTNLSAMERRLSRLLRQFRWDRVDRVYGVGAVHAA